jgi:signal transduction histidine kinase
MAGAMRLASKIFLTSSLLIAVLAAVGALGVRAVGRLVSVNREITHHAVPALRLGSSLRDGLGALARLENRFVILRDARYAALWDETAARFDTDLARLGDAVTTDVQRAALAEAALAFADYRRLVAEERALMERGARERAVELAETEGRARVERVEVTLDRLTDATDAAIAAARTEATRLERRTWTRVLTALGGAVVLALVGTGFIAYRMTRSLSRLSAATAAVATGSFDTTIDVKDRDEVGALARSFNRMAADLQQLERMKGDFFAGISHDLRSPLTSVSEAANLLRDEVAGPLTPKQARLVAIIGSSSQRLLGLVQRIMDLSRLRAGMLPLEQEPVDLERVVDRAVEELRPQAEEAGVTLVREPTRGNVRMTGDEERLVQVAVNLVVNAIHFTPRSGSVTVRLIDAGGEVELHVEDTGAGIPADALDGIFEPYRQAHRGRGGSGLGLAIVRGVVEAHGGRVEVDSTEGKGSRFTVLLPRGRRPA